MHSSRGQASRGAEFPWPSPRQSPHSLDGARREHAWPLGTFIRAVSRPPQRHLKRDVTCHRPRHPRETTHMCSSTPFRVVESFVKLHSIRMRLAGFPGIWGDRRSRFGAAAGEQFRFLGISGILAPASDMSPRGRKRKYGVRAVFSSQGTNVTRSRTRKKDRATQQKEWARCGNLELLRSLELLYGVNLV